MKPLEAVLNFLLSVATLFFRSKRKHKPDKPLVDGTGSPVRLPSEPRDSAGSHRSNSDPGKAHNQATPVNMLGWVLIITGAGGYVFGLFI